MSSPPCQEPLSQLAAWPTVPEQMLMCPGHIHSVHEGTCALTCRPTAFVNLLQKALISAISRRLWHRCLNAFAVWCNNNIDMIFSASCRQGD